MRVRFMLINGESRDVPWGSAVLPERGDHVTLDNAFPDKPDEGVVERRDWSVGPFTTSVTLWLRE